MHEAFSSLVRIVIQMFLRYKWKRGKKSLQLRRNFIEQFQTFEATFMCYLIVFFLFCVDWNGVLLFGLNGFFIIISGVTPLLSFHAVYKRCFFHLIVPGASNFCVACGHGGHTYHLMTWFETMEVCPSGCGCRCLEVGTFIVDWLFLLHKGVKLRERHCRDHMHTGWRRLAQCGTVRSPRLVTVFCRDCSKRKNNGFTLDA